MRVLILDSVVDSVKKCESDFIPLYGLIKHSSKDREFVIASIDPNCGLEQIGYWGKSEEQTKSIKPSLLIESEQDKIASCYFEYDDQGNVKVCQKTKPEIILYKTDFSKRHHGIIDSTILLEKKAAIFGLGTVGSKMAVDLTRAGVEELWLCDFDTISTSNLCRSEYDLFDVGRLKTEAIRDKILRINPLAKPKLFSENILEMDSDKLRNIIENMDLVAVATDRPAAQRTVNGYAYHLTCAVYPGIYPRGSGGDIIFTIPKVTPCMECILKAVSSQQDAVERGHWDYTTKGQLKAEPALGIDIQNVTIKASKIALALLMRDDKSSKIKEIINPESNILFVGNEKEWIFSEPFQTLWGKTEFNPDCWCREELHQQ